MERNNSNNNNGGNGGKRRHNNRDGNNNYKNNNNNNRHNDGKQRGDGPKKEAILDLSKYQNKQIRVKFIGNRQIVGTLKGYDQLMNLVLDDVVETLRDPEDDGAYTNETRKLGLVVVRGPLLLTISPVDGSEEIDNPFLPKQEVTI